MIIKAGNHYINTDDIAHVKSGYRGACKVFFLSTADRFMDNHLSLTQEESLEFHMAMNAILATSFTINLSLKHEPPASE
jgi:hypothetical protein